MKCRTRLTRLLPATLAMVALSGCATYHTTYTNLHPPGADPVEDKGGTLTEAGFFDGWQHFWIFGLLPFENRVELAEECGARPAEQVRTYQSGLQFLLSNVQGAFVFVNVWSPYTAQVDCAAPASPEASASDAATSPRVSGASPPASDGRRA